MPQTFIFHTHTISHLTLAVFQDRPAGRHDESATIHERRSLEASPRGRYTTRSCDRELPHTHRFDIRHRLRRVQTRHSRTRGVVRQIQSRNHLWRQQDRSHRRGPTWCDESISHRHTQVHYQETRLQYASRTVPSVITLKDSEDKAPKALPPGIYADLVEAYNRVTINGQRRTFPEKLLLGAEKIIARMWHEHVKSKCYTGVKLGELLQHRHFTATGSVNNRVTDKTNETVLTIDADTKTLIEKNKQEWDPHTLLMILDGLEAIKWAWTLIRLGDEVDINNFIQRFETLTRRHNDRLQQIKTAWNTFSWQIAMQMRGGVTFKQASQDVTQDTVQLTDILTQASPKKPRRESSPYKGGKGKGKGKQYWRPSRFNRRYQNQPYHNPPPYQYQPIQNNLQTQQVQQWQQQTQWNPPPPPVQWHQQAQPSNPQWTPPPSAQDHQNPKGKQKGKGGKKGKSKQQWQ